MYRILESLFKLNGNISQFLRRYLIFFFFFHAFKSLSICLFKRSSLRDDIGNLVNPSEFSLLFEIVFAMSSGIVVLCNSALILKWFSYWISFYWKHFVKNLVYKILRIFKCFIFSSEFKFAYLLLELF